MPVILAILGLVLAAGVWAWRIRMARQALDDVSMMAGDVIAAARRLGFRRRLNNPSGGQRGRTRIGDGGGRRGISRPGLDAHGGTAWG